MVAVNGLNHLNVLVVDHDPWTRLHVTAALDEVGVVHVAQASNGMTALRLALENPPHVVIVGSALPELSATELMEDIRSNSRTHSAAIVGVQEVTGADAHLPNSCSPVDLLATVVEALEVRRQAVAAAPIRSVIASPRGTWPLVEGDSSRSSSRTRNGGRSGNGRLSSDIETV